MIKYKDKLFNNAKEIRALIGRDAYKQAAENGEIILNYSENCKEEAQSETKLYYFYNPNNKHTITSCLPDLEHLRNVKGYTIDEWIPFEPNK